MFTLCPWISKPQLSPPWGSEGEGKGTDEMEKGEAVGSKLSISVKFDSLDITAWLDLLDIINLGPLL